MSFGMAYATKKRGKKTKNHEAEAAHVIGQARKRRMSHDEILNDPSAGYSEEDKAGIREGINKQSTPMAEGGDVSEHEQDADMIARIMHKRKEYAQGGVVANEDAPIADAMPAEFDDMEVDDHLEGEQPEDSNEIGDDDVGDDPIDRIMMKRKKDKLPKPA